MSRGRYYVVWVGHEPGIYTDWDACRAQVDGFAGAQYRSFTTAAQAELAWVEAGGDPMPLDDVPPPPVVPWGEHGPPLGSIAVDAACSGNPGPMEYQGVDIATGEHLFHVGPMRGTNNIGEFLAIVHGLAWLQGNGRSDPIYSDSTIAINWVRRGRARTTLARSAATEEAYQLLTRAQRWLRMAGPGVIELRKWPTRRWGEIPADFGRK